jgi:hypothetical protein
MGECGAGAKPGIRLASAQGLLDVGFGGAGESGNAAARFVDHYLHDSPPFLGRETGELSRGAVGVQAVDPAFNQPGDKTAQFLLVDLAPIVQGNQQRCEDSFELGQPIRIHGGAAVRIKEAARVSDSLGDFRCRSAVCAAVPGGWYS